MAEVTASIIEICELRPATTSAKKNSGPRIYGAGSRLIAAGKVTKAKPTPADTTLLTAYLALEPCNPILRRS